MFYTSDEVKTLGTILAIWAHPDDETWCAGGLMAAARANNQRVICLTATRGDAGKTMDESRWPQAQLGTIRAAELASALKTLGVQEHYWLNYDDDTLSNCDESAAVQTLGSYIDTYEPDTIISFNTDGLTGHPDHCTIAAWTHAAHRHTRSQATLLCAVETTERYTSDITKKCNEKFNIYFKANQPVTTSLSQADICFVLPATIRTKKIQALREHACQTNHLFTDPIGKAFIQINADHEAFMRIAT